MRSVLLSIHICVIFTCFAFSQESNYPFPQNIKYPYGYMPSTFSTENYNKWYSSFRNNKNFLISCGSGKIAAAADNTSTIKVEAMGWAMIFIAYMGDKETFDGLYAFYKSKLKGHGMMDWRVSCSGGGDGGSASDGDLDVAFSLVVAMWQWGEEYKQEAIDVITLVKKLITDCSGTSVIVGGYGSGGNTPYGGCSKTDISYYTPAFFREFAKLTGDKDWDKLADDTYTVLNNGANAKTGLVPDWQTWQGQAQGSYGYDACRVPWRMSLDYLWNGNEEAQKWCTKVTDWAYKVGPANIKSGYSLDGSGGGWPGMSYVGSFGVSSMVHSQEAADAFGKHIAGMSFDTYWYHAYLGVCYMLTMSGNMWRPGLDTVSVKNNEGRLGHINSFLVNNIVNRELVLSGIRKGSSITLTSLDGRRVRYIASTAENRATFDISSVKSGCYLLTVSNGRGAGGRSRLVTVY